MEESQSYSLAGCNCGSRRFGISVVQSKWLLVHYFGKLFKVEMNVYLLWCMLWLFLFFTGWLSFQHAHPNPFTPGEIMFDLFVLVSSSFVFGNIISALVSLPPLFGYMIVGIIVRNMPGNPTSGITSDFSNTVKEIALTIIVGRAGLGLPVNTFMGDVKDIRKIQVDGNGHVACHEVKLQTRISQSIGKLKNGLLLAITPMAFEAAAYCGMAMLVFKFNVVFALLLGFVMAAVSPAVVVPGLIDLQAKGHLGKGNTTPVPSIVMFSSGLDDVFAITFFGIFFGMAYGDGAILSKIIKAPVEVIGGIVLGFVLGWMLFKVAISILPVPITSNISREAQKVAQDNDVAVFGITHAHDPHNTSPNKMPSDSKSHSLVFLIVFVTCVCEVIGFGHIAVADAGELKSLGVLGAMAACFAINYNFSKGSFKLMMIRNDVDNIKWFMQSSASDNDPKIRKFFHMSKGDTFPSKLHQLEEMIPDLIEREKAHQEALGKLNLNMKYVWDLVACPLLFSLVGSSIDMNDILYPEYDEYLLPKGLAVIFICLLARCCGAMLACIGSGWSLKNKLFVALAWLPKATVQAAVGGLALAEAKIQMSAKNCVKGIVYEENPCKEIMEKYDWSEVILQISVIGILVTAPLGAAAISILGPKWLEKRDVQRHHPSMILNTKDVDSAAISRYFHPEPSAELDVDNIATGLGQRPEGRQLYRIKRAASFPASLAMSNPNPADPFKGYGMDSGMLIANRNPLYDFCSSPGSHPAIPIDIESEGVKTPPQASPIPIPSERNSLAREDMASTLTVTTDRDAVISPPVSPTDGIQ